MSLTMELNPTVINCGIPPKDSQGPAERLQQEAATPVQPRKLAVVCDDFEPVAHMISEILEEEGFETLLAGDGAQALALLQERSVDLLVTDLHMPGQEGIQTINQIRKMKMATKIVVVSGARPEILAAARLLGASALFAKPISTVEFRRFIREFDCSPGSCGEVQTVDGDRP